MKDLISLKLKVDIDKVRKEISPLNMNAPQPLRKKSKNRRRKKMGKVIEIDATIDSELESEPASNQDMPQSMDPTSSDYQK